MANRNRSLRKLSGVTPDSPEFTVLVKKSQLYRDAISESIMLVERLRDSHQKNIELRKRLYEANMILYNLKLAAVGAIQDVAVQNVEAQYRQEAEKQLALPGFEAGPEERPATPQA